MIKTAVILAAGVGSRFGTMTLNKPKGFIKVCGQTMIERSIENLVNCGFEKIIIGTGYCSEYYEELAMQYPQITCQKVDKYLTRGSMYTLYQCSKLVDTDILLLESDIIYEEIAIDIIRNSFGRNVILGAGLTKFQDQYYLSVDSRGQLQGCSPSKEELTSIDGEFVGITKISFSFLQQMCALYKATEGSEYSRHYDRLLVHPQLCSLIDVVIDQDLVWYEIDDEADLKFVERNVVLV